MSSQFFQIAVGLAAVSLGLIGVILAGAALWPEEANKYKNYIGNVIFGLVLIVLAGVIIAVIR